MKKLNLVLGLLLAVPSVHGISAQNNCDDFFVATDIGPSFRNYKYEWYEGGSYALMDMNLHTKIDCGGNKVCVKGDLLDYWQVTISYDKSDRKSEFSVIVRE